MDGLNHMNVKERIIIEPSKENRVVIGEEPKKNPFSSVVLDKESDPLYDPNEDLYDQEPEVCFNSAEDRNQ